MFNAAEIGLTPLSPSFLHAGRLPPPFSTEGAVASFPCKNTMLLHPARPWSASFLGLPPSTTASPRLLHSSSSAPVAAPLPPAAAGSLPVYHQYGPPRSTQSSWGGEGDRSDRYAAMAWMVPPIAAAAVGLPECEVRDAPPHSLSPAHTVSDWSDVPAVSWSSWLRKGYSVDILGPGDIKAGAGPCNFLGAACNVVAGPVHPGTYRYCVLMCTTVL